MATQSKIVHVNPETGEVIKQDYISGAAQVIDQGYVSGANDGVLATSTTAASLTLDSSSARIEITNLSLTATEYLICAFGVDAADAETNLATGGFTVAAGMFKERQIPANALGGGFAYKSASGTPSMGFSEGQ